MCSRVNDPVMSDEHNGKAITDGVSAAFDFGTGFMKVLNERIQVINVGSMRGILRLQDL